VSAEIKCAKISTKATRSNLTRNPLIIVGIRLSNAYKYNSSSGSESWFNRDKKDMKLKN
jgi:hypothetical protein